MWTWEGVFFLNVYINVFHQICKVFEHEFFKYSSYPLFSLLLFFDFLIMHTLACLMLCHRSLRHSSFFFTLFLFLRLDLSSPVSEVIDIFLLPAQICCWAPLVKFSFKLLYLSTPLNFLLVLFIVFTSLMIFSDEKSFLYFSFIFKTYLKLLWAHFKSAIFKYSWFKAFV